MSKTHKGLTMNAEAFQMKLEELQACSDARAWAAGKSLSQAWQECNRPDWMLWLLGRSSVGKKVIATIAVEFAEMSSANAKEYPTVAECIATVKRFLHGEATQEELSAAESAAEYAARYAATYAATFAAWSAARSAEYAARSAEYAARYAARSAEYAAEYAAYAAEHAAWSAARSAADSAESAAAYMAAESAARYAADSAARSAATAQCDIIRKHVDASRSKAIL